jgi:hypothetical protein
LTLACSLKTRYVLGVAPQVKENRYMSLRASWRARSAFLFSMAAVLFLLLVLVGCGGDDGGQEQQDQASEEATTQEATQETTSQGEQITEEQAPFTKVTADRQYAGRVEGTNALIGIAVRDQTNELIAYVCDMPPQGQPGATSIEAWIEAWFQGPIEGDQASLVADGGEEQLQAVLTPADTTGTFTDVDGQTYTFLAPLVDPEGKAGLHWTEPIEGEGLSARGGTIILPDGEKRGLVKHIPFSRR